MEDAVCKYAEEKAGLVRKQWVLFTLQDWDHVAVVRCPEWKPVSELPAAMP